MEPPQTLSRHAMRSILGYLDAAMAESRRADAFSNGGAEGNGTWNIRMARTRLLEAALSDVAVEAEPV